MADFKPTDELKGYREELANLTELALNLAGARCELALQAGEVQKQVDVLMAQMEKIGRELTHLGGQELDIHVKRRQLAKLIMDGDVGKVGYQ